ncbi:MAG: cellulase family glycosylhydrolase [Cyclobacteriaceae bacterium]
MKKYLIIYSLLILPIMLPAQSTHTLKVKGLGFTLNDEPFFYTGVSFFNAIYNPTFNQNDESRKIWLNKLKTSGINVVRIWGQWDNKRGFVDSNPDATLYEKDGRLQPQKLSTLKKIIQAADELQMVVLFVLFANESWEENIRLSDEASDKAVKTLAEELRPYRNLVFQIWNEFDHRTTDYLKIIKASDPARLVTNSPGWGGVLGNIQENAALDFLSPHTTRVETRQWEIAPKEIAYLLEKYQKPVVDDEPARRGTPKFGGPKNPTSPYDHIIRIYNVWKAGGHVVYHHDMFQLGYDHESIPPTGIPDPDFSPYHKVVFDFLANKERYVAPIRKP